MKQLRLRAELTLREAAEAVGLAFSQISKIEKNDTIYIKPSVLKKFALAYKTTPEFIETGQHPKPAAPGPNDTVMLVDTTNLEFIELPFIVPSAYGTFNNSCHDHNYDDFDIIRIVKRPGVDYKGAVVLEVRGNSMAPRYPDRSQHVVRPVSDGNWQHALGVHAIALRSPAFIIKRIASNLNGTLRLRSDSNGEEMEIMLGDINCMWKVGESVYMPEED